jgi:hypothetical protein
MSLHLLPWETCRNLSTPGTVALRDVATRATTLDRDTVLAEREGDLRGWAESPFPIR